MGVSIDLDQEAEISFCSFLSRSFTSHLIYCPYRPSQREKGGAGGVQEGDAETHRCNFTRVEGLCDFFTGQQLGQKLSI